MKQDFFFLCCELGWSSPHGTFLPGATIGCSVIPFSTSLRDRLEIGSFWEKTLMTLAFELAPRFLFFFSELLLFFGYLIPQMATECPKWPAVSSPVSIILNNPLNTLTFRAVWSFKITFLEIYTLYYTVYKFLLMCDRNKVPSCWWIDLCCLPF